MRDPAETAAKPASGKASKHGFAPAPTSANSRAVTVTFSGKSTPGSRVLSRAVRSPRPHRVTGCSRPSAIAKRRPNAPAPKNCQISCLGPLFAGPEKRRAGLIQWPARAGGQIIPSRCPSRNRSIPAQAIIAALSVQSAQGRRQKRAYRCPRKQSLTLREWLGLRPRHPQRPKRRDRPADQPARDGFFRHSTSTTAA